jgi:hypothetical protein
VPNINVLGDVSRTLASVLTTSLSPLSAVAEVNDLLSVPAAQPPYVTVFLYEVVEDGSARNRPQVRRESGNDILIRKPPLALLLKYMFTPWSDDELTVQTLLGRVLQALYEGPIISGPQLLGTLANTTESLKVCRTSLTIDEVTDIWRAVNKPFRLSATYEVRVVNLDAEVDLRAAPVSNRRLDVATPEVTA